MHKVVKDCETMQKQMIFLMQAPAVEHWKYRSILKISANQTA